MPDRVATVDELFALLERCATVTDSIVGGDRTVTILDHGLQCAAVLTGERPEDRELQVAGLVHDVGHVLAPGDADGHGRHAAAAIRQLLGSRVARLVELHVPAKRYLVTTHPSYRQALSDGSTRTLELQGGPLEHDEVRALEADPDLADALTLRRADEAAKIPDRPVPGLGSWRSTVEALTG